MAVSEKDPFTWKIENFSMCPHLLSEHINSSIFAVAGSKWQLRVYPRGHKYKNYTSCYLKRIDPNDKEELLTIPFELAMKSVHPEKDVRYKISKSSFKNNDAWGSSKFHLRENILNIMNGFLPHDTLTIECRIWRKIDEGAPKSPARVFEVADLTFSDSFLQKEIFSTVDRDELLDFQTQFVSGHCFASTRIPVDRKCIICSIRSFNTLLPAQRTSIPVVTAVTDAPFFAMTLNLSGESVNDQRVEIEIRMDESDVKKVYFVRCRINVINGPINEHCVAEDEHIFKSTNMNDVWKFPSFIRMISLTENKYLDATQGTLYLQCEFAFSSKKIEDRLYIEGCDTMFLLSPFPKPIKGMNDGLTMSKQVYEEGKFSDVTLRVGARTFKAHKNILSARSPVFKAMFDTDMQENTSGVVDITEYDPYTVEWLLIFIYTNSLEDLQQEMALKLYSVADKYDVLALKWQCSSLLKSTLSTSNVCEVLTLADLHQDKDLLDYVRKYIQLNSDVILSSQLWKDLMKSNILLASQIMLDMLTGKMKHL